jgi:hypothetical protein
MVDEANPVSVPDGDASSLAFMGIGLVGLAVIGSKKELEKGSPSRWIRS